MLFFLFNFFNEIILKGLFFSVAIVLFSKQVVPSISISIQLQIIRICLIVLGSCSIYFLVNFLLQEETNGIPLVANITYNSAYKIMEWLTIVFRIILPFSLLFKKTKNNVSYILLVSILINLNWIFDQMIIHIIQPEDLRFFPEHSPLFSFISGITFGLILTIISFMKNILNPAENE